MQMPHGMKMEPAAQLAASTLVQLPLGAQHAPGHGLGVQLVPAPSQMPPKKVLQMACVVGLQVWLMMLQHAPMGTHGLGLHEVPEVHEVFGGIGQLACVVCVQLPRALQHAPWSGKHGLIGTHVPAGVQLRFGGTGHNAKVVGVQMPLKSQHAPIGRQGLGLHVPPCVQLWFGGTGHCAWVV